MNKYSLNAESYGITKKDWYKIRDDVKANNINSVDVSVKYNFKLDKDGKIDLRLQCNRLWFLYDKLLQEKYNHLYKRDKLVNPKVGDYVYCDYEGFGRGTITKMFEDGLMLVKFDKRKLPTMCDSKSCVTVHDDIKRKISKI